MTNILKIGLMQIIIVKDYHELSKKAAQIVVNHVHTWSNNTLGLPTGNTPRGMYAELVDKFKEKEVDFSKIKTFNLNEYAGLSKDNKSSFAHYIDTNFLSQVNVNGQNTHLLNGNAKDLNEECKNYEKQIEEANGLDLVILGIGINGHIGFNEPGTAFNSHTHTTTLSKSTVEMNLHDFGNISRMPKKAITMGLGTIFKARKIVLLASGPKKAEAIYNLVYGEVTRNFPASILKTHDDVTLIIDESSATEIVKAGYTDQKITEFTIYEEPSLPANKNIVIISPHPDDSAISAGGTLYMLAQKNTVTTLIMTSGFRASINNLSKEEKTVLRAKEAKNESKILGTNFKMLNLDFYSKNRISDKDVSALLKEFKSLKPDIVFLAPKNDLHPTHRMSTDIALQALKRYVDSKKEMAEIWFYESPWRLFQPGDFNAVVGLTKNAFNKKILAVREHKSQIERTPYDEVSKAVALIRGAIVPEQILGKYGQVPNKFVKYAEAFQISRILFEHKLIETLSGIRGIYGNNLNEEIAEKYGFAFGSWLKNKIKINPKITIGRDSRPSGKTLTDALIKGLEKANCHIFNLGIGTTPMVQFEVRNKNSNGGVIITASHNEPDWNGFKFLWSDGGILKPNDMQKVINIYHSLDTDADKNLLNHYIKYINDSLDKTTINKIRKAKLKAVVDPNGGAIIVLLKKLFENFNIKTVELNMDIGVFKHKVEPSRDALKHMGPIVDENKADFGVAWDCDGDRVELILPGKRHISGHYVLAMLVDEVLNTTSKNKFVVISSATSNVVMEVAKKHKAKTFITDVGEPNVVSKMYEINAPVGGEGTCGGGIVRPSRCRDGVLTLFKILALMTRSGKTLNEIINSYPVRYTLQKSVKIPASNMKRINRIIQKHFKKFEIKKYGASTKYFLSNNSWILFRQSKTENDLLRIVADAPNRTVCQKIIQDALELVY